MVSYEKNMPDIVNKIHAAKLLTGKWSTFPGFHLIIEYHKMSSKMLQQIYFATWKWIMNSERSKTKLPHVKKPYSFVWTRNKISWDEVLPVKNCVIFVSSPPPCLIFICFLSLRARPLIRDPPGPFLKQLKRSGPLSERRTGWTLIL